MPTYRKRDIGRITRRMLLATAAASTALPAVAEECQIGPPPHPRGPLIWMDYDQVELDAAYDQLQYAPLMGQNFKRQASLSEEVRTRLGEPLRRQYGQTKIEELDIYRTSRPNAPVFVFVHGGAWVGNSAKNNGFQAELFVNAGIHYVALDFINVKEADGDLGRMAEQVRRGIAWAYQNAASFGADRDRLYVGGFSSGGHLCGVSLVTDWQKDFGLPPDCIKGGLCMSGMYDMKPVRLSKRSEYIKFTDEMELAMSSQRQIDRLRAPLIVTYGTNDTPEFQRQARDFSAAVKAAGKPVELIQAANFGHQEMLESLSNPYGPNGRAALGLIKVS
jgi:arylformamidase